MRTLFLAVAAVGLISTSAVFAECRTTPSRFQLGQPEPTQVSGETDGAACSHRFRAGGRSIFTSASIVRSPRHGTLTQRESFNFFYKPAAGFVGVDGYSVKICGKSFNEPGCALIDYVVDVK